MLIRDIEAGPWAAAALPFMKMGDAEARLCSCPCWLQPGRVADEVPTSAPSL